MTPQEAISILDQATGTLNTTRENHVKIQQALQALHNNIIREEVKSEESKE